MCKEVSETSCGEIDTHTRSFMKKLLFALVLFLAAAGPVLADRYYCLLFAYDSQPISLPCKSHVWGLFIQVDDNGKLVKEVPISWEPDKVSYFDFRRPGWHSSDSLDFAVKKKKQICMWGPFETDESFFKKAVLSYEGQGNYKFIDCCWRSSAQNCIHKLSDIAGPHRTGIYWGWWAGDSVYKHYKRHGVIRNANNRETIIFLLGIQKFPVKRMQHD